ncbi:hypothetical protein BDV98DRAFT_577909 [Pterulicium gracile]|uniref:Uncharacterized protein n=1 Tax=Pterulicium gracile TaxID=1884261 RepID=A0A5C3Q174_9AGAR|nr:hypothetical protein BDV98DRAFT_577909 [Pterula gracilis]
MFSHSLTSMDSRQAFLAHLGLRLVFNLCFNDPSVAFPFTSATEVCYLSSIIYYHNTYSSTLVD